MKNIQKQYTDLLEGKMSKANFMRNVRMQFPQHVSPVSSFEDSVKILKGKRILSEAPEGVYGHNPNAETPPAPGIDQLNYYQVYHGIQYELAQMPEITDENYFIRKHYLDNDSLTSSTSTHSICRERSRKLPIIFGYSKIRSCHCSHGYIIRT